MENSSRVPLWKVVSILIGFPIISYILSLLLLNRRLFSDLGIDFFEAFWLLISLWYVIQIIAVIKTINTAGLSLSEIGYSLNTKRTTWLILGYLVFAFTLFALVEFALASANITQEMLNSLSDFSNITPKTSRQRIIFIFAGLVAGISEEIVYRGFAISMLEKFKINKWIAVGIASIPFVFQHGVKSLDQFWWFFITGLLFGAIYIGSKRKLPLLIILHWIIILSALLAILQLLE